MLHSVITKYKIYWQSFILPYLVFYLQKYENATGLIMNYNMSDAMHCGSIKHLHVTDWSVIGREMVSRDMIGSDNVMSQVG